MIAEIEWSDLYEMEEQPIPDGRTQDACFGCSYFDVRDDGYDIRMGCRLTQCFMVAHEA